jgi:catalase (peroxidase I)
MENKSESNTKEGECPFGYSEQKKIKTKSYSNADWWPNQLNLKILHQIQCKMDLIMLKSLKVLT